MKGGAVGNREVNILSLKLDSEDDKRLKIKLATSENPKYEGFYILACFLATYALCQEDM